MVIGLLVMKAWYTPERVVAERKRTTPAKTHLMDQGYRQIEKGSSELRALGRPAVGDWVAGTPGVLVRAATTPPRRPLKIRTVVFKVWYEDGHTAIEVLHLPDMRYKKYMKLTEAS